MAKGVDAFGFIFGYTVKGFDCHHQSQEHKGLTVLSHKSGMLLTVTDAEAERIWDAREKAHRKEPL